MMKKLLLLMLFFGIVSSSVFSQDEPEPQDLTDYKTACLDAINKINSIANGVIPTLTMWESLAFNTAVAGAKAGLDECETSEAMQGVMTSLRAFTIALLQTKESFNENLNFTGLISNQSFDTGDLSSWSTIGFDLNKVDIDQIRNDIITRGDVSGLVDGVIINEWKEETKAVENQGDNYISGGHNKYYLNSDKQLLMQPLLGLPAGVYNFSAKVAAPILNNVYLNVLVISADIAQEFIGYELPQPETIDYSSILNSISWVDIITGKVDFAQLASEKLPELLGVESVSNWTDILSNTSKIWENIEPLLEFGRLYSKSIWVGNSFENTEMKFMVDEGDVVFIGLNAGLTQFIGLDQYRADNLRLTGLRSLGGILSSARKELAAALEGLSLVEANYNADAPEGAAQPAFSYDKALTENYNNAYLTAKNNSIKRMKDILSQEDLNDLDVVEEKLNQYKAELNANIQALKAAKEAFDKGAFIAPQADELFNILMTLPTPEWAGNAVSIDDNMTMSFSQKPGESAFALAFSFEKASEEVNNQFYAFVSDGMNKYYLGEKDGNLALTTDKAEAVVVTAIPSYTTEGEVSLMVGETYLGTSSDSDTFVKTDGEEQLTGLGVRSAAEVAVTVNVPAERGVSTVILPFDADLPSDVSACTISGIGTDLPYIVNENVTSLKANTPYCIVAAAGDYTFSGVSHALMSSYGDGLLIGRFTPYTTQGGNEYKMTVDVDGFAVFNRADGQPIAANECYLKSDEPSDVIFFTEADAVTGIGEVESSGLMVDSPVFDLSGRRVNTSLFTLPSSLSKGIYIQGSKKILR